MNKLVLPSEQDFKKKKNARSITLHSFRLAVLLTILVVVLSLITRIALLIQSAAVVDFTVLNILGIFSIGLFYDLINAAYFILPLMIYIWLMPDRALRKGWQRFVHYGIFSFFYLWSSF